MTIDEILEDMDDLLDKAVSVPFSSKKSMIDTDKMRELIDKIRYNLPTEIKQAKEMVFDRSQILTGGKKEAEVIIKKAEDKAKKLISEDEIIKQAKKEASDILNKANAMDKQIRAALNEKMDSMLGDAENLFSKSMEDIKQTRAALKSTNNKK